MIHNDRHFLRGATSVAHALQIRADRHPDRLAVVQPLAGGRCVTYAELFKRARELADELTAARTKSARAPFAVIALPNSIDYVVSFYACVLATVTAITLYPPTLGTARATRAFSERITAVLDDANPFAVIGETEFLADFGRELTEDSSGATTDRVLIDPATITSSTVAGADATGRSDDIALLQYTSGSTSAPKGVILSNANLLANIEAVTRALRTGEGQAIVSWLPLYHDMGLIGAVLHPLWAGMTLHLLTPTDFLRNPPAWLRLLSETRATIAMAPNFAYDLCVRRSGELSKGELDLSHLRHALNGAEPVRVATIDAFQQTFGAYGFAAEAMMPVYGLAENTVGVSIPPQRHLPKVFSAQRDALRTRRRYVPDTSDRSVGLVGCGRDIEGTETVIVDPGTHQPLADGAIGEVWITGTSMSAGYYRKPDETRERFGLRLPDDGRPFFRTGDLACKVEGYLCIVGRSKDLIVKNGHNYYPADLEQTAESAHPVIDSIAAAFSVVEADAERVVIVQEIKASLTSTIAETVMSAIRSVVMEEHGLRVDAITLVPKGQLPKTTSGKLQRRKSRNLWVRGGLRTLAHAGVHPSQLEGIS